MPAPSVETFGDLGQDVEQWEVERGVHAHQEVRVGGETARVLCDLLVIVGYFAECEEIGLADAQRIFTDGVAEDPGEVPLHVLQRVDSETVDVEPGDQVLVGADQQVSGGELEAGLRCGLSEVGGDLLERVEVADHARRVRCALPPE